ncbi:MAG: hypothetical protein PHS54_01205 [Clostridia bacterium]|nr:hypothetical protein [Clostridia bacterium]
MQKLRTTMKKQLIVMAFGILMLFSLFSIVSAAPPFETNIGSEGLQLFYPQFETVSQDMNFNLHIHASNISNGFPLYNTDYECNIHLYNSTGDHTFQGELENNGNEWDKEVYLTSGNFSDLGTHAFYIWCNNSYLGGEVRGTFEVTPTGTELTTANAIFYGFILLLIGMFIFFSIAGMRKTESGGWLIFYICLTYILIYALMGILFILAGDFLWATPIIENVLYIVWFVMGIGFLPFVIVLSLYILGQEARAALEEDYMKQGYTRDEARDLSKKNKR